ncbi:MAG: DUF6495 family protein [Flavobacteriales bacterium]
MQFPCLTLEQLEVLESDFVAFLIVNGVEGDTWKTLNQTNPSKAQELANLFSQVVWEKVLKETRFVKRVSETERIFGYLGEQEGVLYVGQQHSNGWDFHIAKKQWVSNRSHEVFNLMQQGFERATEQEYSEVNQLLKTK